MPTYYFIVHNRDTASEPIAYSLPDLGAAKREAVRALTDIASDELPNDGDRESFWVGIQDDKGRELLVASLEFKVFDLKPRTGTAREDASSE